MCTRRRTEFLDRHIVGTVLASTDCADALPGSSRLRLPGQPLRPCSAGRVARPAVLPRAGRSGSWRPFPLLATTSPSVPDDCPPDVRQAGCRGAACSARAPDPTARRRCHIPARPEMRSRGASPCARQPSPLLVALVRCASPVQLALHALVDAPRAEPEQARRVERGAPRLLVVGHATSSSCSHSHGVCVVWRRCLPQVLQCDGRQRA